MIIELIIYGIIAYLLGSIPTAVWVGKCYYAIDIREHGSKNAGATNTFRVLGKKAGIFVLLMDVLKGVMAVLLPKLISDLDFESKTIIELTVGILVILGHVFPVFANFKGGKGVATSLGIIIGIYPIAAALCFSVFLIIFLSSKYVSLGAIISSFLFPFIVVFYLKSDSIYLNAFSILLGFTVILTHRKNISRLINGTENKMNVFKK